MLLQVGVVKQLSGYALAVGTNGNQRILQVGDAVFAGEVVKTIGNTNAVLSMDNGKQMDIGASDSVLLDSSVTQDSGFGQDAVVADLADLQKVILAGIDLSNLEETAAGSSAGSGEGGTAQINPAYFADGGHYSNVNADYRDLGTFGDDGVAWFTSIGGAPNDTQDIDGNKSSIATNPKDAKGGFAIPSVLADSKDTPDTIKDKISSSGGAVEGNDKDKDVISFKVDPGTPATTVAYSVISGTAGDDDYSKVKVDSNWPTDGIDVSTLTDKINIKVSADTDTIDGKIVMNVSEEGLAGGIKDTRGDSDATDSATTVKTIAAESSSAVKFAFVAPSNTDSGLKSGGVTVVWEKSDDNTMIGKAGSEEVLKVTLNANTGEVNAVLNKPIDHSVNEKYTVKNVEDILSTSLKVKATNTFGSTAEADIKINIEDDSPEFYVDATKDIEVTFAEQVNATLVLDFSASMLWGINDDPNKDTERKNYKTSEKDTRLEIAKEKILKMLDEYQELGSDNVKISIVGFAKTAKVLDSNGQTWMSIAEAKDIINKEYAYDKLKSLWDNVNLDIGAGTNYDAALAVVMDKFKDSGKLSGNAKNKLYFISDGEPTVSDGSAGTLTNQGGSKADNGIGEAEEAIWKKFLVDNKIDSDAFMLSKDVKQADLNPIAYDGINNKDKNARLFEDLKFEVALAMGKIAHKDSALDSDGVDFAFGADGAKEVSITINDNGTKGIKYTYDFATDTITPNTSATIKGSKLTITTKEGSKLTIDMKDGSYEYNASQGVAKSGGKETIGITYEVVDKDNDGKGNEKTTTLNFKSSLPSIVLDSYEDSVSRVLKAGSNSPVTIDGASAKITVDNSNVGTSKVALTNDATPVLVFNINAQESGFVSLLNSNGTYVVSNAAFSKGDKAIKITIGADGRAESYATTSDGVTWNTTSVHPDDKVKISALDLKEENDKFRAEITTKGGKSVVDVVVNLDITPDTIQNLDASFTKKDSSYNLDFKGNVSDTQNDNAANTSKTVKIIDLDDLDNPTTASVDSNGDFVNSITGITEGKNYLVEHTDAAGNVTRETYTIIKNSGLDVDMYFYNYRDKLVMTSEEKNGESGYIQTGDNYKKWLDKKEPSATATADKLSFGSSAMGKTNGDIDVNETAKFTPNNYTLREALPVGTDVIVKMDGYIYIDAPGVYYFKTSGHNNKSTLCIDGKTITSTVFQSNPVDGSLVPATGSFNAAKAGFYKISVDYVDMEGTAALNIDVSKTDGSNYKTVGTTGSGTHLYSNSYVKALEQNGKISADISSTSDSSISSDNISKNKAFIPNGSFNSSSNDLIGLKQNENTIEGSNLDEKFVYDTNKTIDAKGGTDTLIVMDNIDFTKVADLNKKLNSFEKIQMGANGKDGAVEMTLDARSSLDIIDSVVTKNKVIDINGGSNSTISPKPIENVSASDKSVNTVLKIVGDQHDVLKLKGFKQLTEQNELKMLNDKHNVVGDKENQVDTNKSNVYKCESNGETVYIEADKNIKVEIDI
ncbi:hypothetical protein CR66_05815 [Campylobacter mucosalis]|uniref:retention module-containing protein n=1 Tax=Campylobacter mucosalis TaxID=202 RepID=UPI0004D52F9E|nr:retention module-containing protein [Campylobacter mucosalis]KEA45668.1 hypothetical protein CR66_05815 [Campylobacter mucosalis]QKF63473.1 von Willebrand factor type A (vWA) domain-containing protein [Campylobacter mucosalis]